MKSLRLTLAIASLILACPLIAQQGVQTRIPFSFYVGNSQLMPAGTYRITPCNTHVVMVRNCNEGITILQLTNTGERENKDPGKLIFHKYGDTYFLSEVQGPALSTGLVLPMGTNEKKLKSETANVRTYETITIPKQTETKRPNK